MKRTVVVLAGGLGTRVAHITGEDTPKAMLPVCGRAFIDWKLAELVAAGADEVVMLVGHGADSLHAHIGPMTYDRVPVHYAEDGPRLLGTGGAIRRVLDRLPNPFWATYGDSLLSAPLEAVEARLARNRSLTGIMTVLCNQDRWETSNVSVDDDLLVAAYEKGSPAGSHEYIDYGMLLLRHELFTRSGDDSRFDLSDVLCKAVGSHSLGAAVVRERFHDIGTKEAWCETEKWARETALWERLQRRIDERAAARDLHRP